VNKRSARVYARLLSRLRLLRHARTGLDTLLLLLRWGNVRSGDAVLLHLYRTAAALIVNLWTGVCARPAAAGALLRVLRHHGWSGHVALVRGRGVGVGSEVEVRIQTGVIRDVGGAIHAVGLHGKIEVDCGRGGELAELSGHLHIWHAGGSITYGAAVGGEVDLGVAALHSLLHAAPGFVQSAPGFQRLIGPQLPFL